MISLLMNHRRLILLVEAFRFPLIFSVLRHTAKFRLEVVLGVVVSNMDLWAMIIFWYELVSAMIIPCSAIMNVDM